MKRISWRSRQAVCLYRRHAGIDGPLFLGMDTHALSEPAFASALEVLAANGVETMIDEHGGYTPTPVISHAILTYNRGRKTGLADGIVISPSHNPPDEGGFKYNPTNGGPADVDVTGWIEKAANEFLRQPSSRASHASPMSARARALACHAHDYITPYVADLANVVDMEAIRAAGVRIGIDPLGGAAVQYWAPIIERYKIAATVVNDAIDPTFRFMTVDWDGKIRMDCSSPYAMTRLIAMRDKFDIAFANDTDADRHGIVCPSGGLMNPNHFLAAAIAYLYANRPGWRHDSAVGKTVVSSGMIDRVAAKLGRKLIEVPVGFKWFSGGLIDGSLGFGGEESAGASFLRRDGSVWTTDKDGLIMGLLAAEITARTGQDPNQFYASATQDLGKSFYERIDAPATREQKAAARTAGSRKLRGERTRWRADRSEAEPRPRQQPTHRRDQGGRQERLVRRPAIGNGGCLQDLRGKLPQRGSSETNSNRCADPHRTPFRKEMKPVWRPLGRHGARTSALCRKHAHPGLPRLTLHSRLVAHMSGPNLRRRGASEPG